MDKFSIARRPLAAAMLAAASLIAAPLAANAAATGVAFVHGTGNQSNAYQDYWQPAMVDSVRGGLANPSNYVVINCDFEQYMWDSRAAGCLAQQLTSFISAKGITQLIAGLVVTGYQGCVLIDPLDAVRDPLTFTRLPHQHGQRAGVDDTVGVLARSGDHNRIRVL